MNHHLLLTRLVLDFQDDRAHCSNDLSAVCRDDTGHLWVASDETASIERLTATDAQTYAAHQRFDLHEYLPLPADADLEIDIEGLDFAGGYLWIAGSHSPRRKKPKGKDASKDALRLAEVRNEPQRCFLARVPLVGGELHSKVKSAEGRSLTAAWLPPTASGNAITEALAHDPHLGPFLVTGIPGKDNGFDIEGLCIHGDFVTLGLRGPVLRGYALVLTLKIDDAEKGCLKLVPVTPKGPLIQKAFMGLDGLGIRDLRLRGKEMFILAGPTMALDGAIRLFKLSDVGALSEGVIEQEEGVLERLMEFPHGVGTDRAEGLAFLPWRDRKDTILVVYDGPRPERVLGKRAVLADVWMLPQTDGKIFR